VITSAPWAYVPRETHTLKCHECGLTGTTPNRPSCKGPKIPQEREHDPCRAIAKARRDARGVAAKKLSRRNGA